MRGKRLVYTFGLGTASGSAVLKNLVNALRANERTRSSNSVQDISYKGVVMPYSLTNAWCIHSAEDVIPTLHTVREATTWSTTCLCWRSGGRS